MNLKQAGKKLEHNGIKVEFLGQIELFYDRGNHHEFTSLVKELSPPGELLKSTTYDFEFKNVEKPHETYTGINVRLRCVCVCVCVCVLAIRFPSLLARVSAGTQSR